MNELSRFRPTPSPHQLRKPLQPVRPVKPDVVAWYGLRGEWRDRSHYRSYYRPIA